MRKYISRSLIIICTVCCLMSTSLASTSKVSLKKTSEIEKQTSALAPVVSVCRWKFDAPACLNFSFDDDLKTHDKISRIFDLYGYKATFFAISSFNYPDSIKDMYARGHEISNHTFTHPNAFVNLDSTTIDYEVRRGNERNENLINRKCLNFASPFHNYVFAGAKTIFTYNVVCRDFTPSSLLTCFGMDGTTTMAQVNKYLTDGVKSRALLLVCAHGIDGEGWGPITKELVTQMLDTAKLHVDRGEIWLTTAQEGELYYNLYQEVKLTQKICNDTLIVTINNYKRDKYKDFPSSPISLSIPNSKFSDIKCLSDKVDVRKFNSETVFSFDLQKDTTLTLQIKTLDDITTDTLKDDLSILLFPNPVSDNLFMQVIGDIQFAEVYDLQGSLVLVDNNNSGRINLSTLKAGMYMIKVHVNQNGSTVILRNKFLKL